MNLRRRQRVFQSSRREAEAGRSAGAALRTRASLSDAFSAAKRSGKGWSSTPNHLRAGHLGPIAHRCVAETPSQVSRIEADLLVFQVTQVSEWIYGGGTRGGPTFDFGHEFKPFSGTTRRCGEDLRENRLGARSPAGRAPGRCRPASGGCRQSEDRHRLDFPCSQ